MFKTQRIHRRWLAALPVLLAMVVGIPTSGHAADEGRIAFASDRTGRWQVYTANPDGTDQVQLTNLAPAHERLADNSKYLSGWKTDCLQLQRRRRSRSISGK